MVFLPEPIAALIHALTKLPGIGARSAERIALHVVQSEKEAVRRLADALLVAREKVQACEICGALTERQPCAICDNPQRDGALLCVVEKAVDIITIEKAGTFRGKYHVLGGKISPTNGIGPEDLRIGPLVTRIANGVREVISALPSDVEGDATSFYLAKVLGSRGVRISRLAHGLPVGGGLEFADELTLSRAIEGRRDIE